jgi:hypothetical protein
LAIYSLQSAVVGQAIVPDGGLSGRRWTLAFYSLRSAVQWGRQSCLQAAFQAAVESEQTTHEFARIFSGFASCRHREARPEKSPIHDREAG